jgi:UDP:flavonoid glycosyltransferase YjiC (YdhE family)
MEEAVVQVAASMPVAAIIHTTLVPGSSNSSSNGSNACSGSGHEQARGRDRQGAGLPACSFRLSRPVPHELLLPQCDLTVHHGGAGTTQAALLAGRWNHAF